MSNEAEWITARINEARKDYPSVTKAVLSRIEKLLSGKLSEKQLTLTEFTSVAESLINEMNDDVQATETKQ